MENVSLESPVERASNREPLDPELRRLKEAIPKLEKAAVVRRGLIVELRDEAEGIEKMLEGFEQAYKWLRQPGSPMQRESTDPEHYVARNGDLRGIAAVREVMCEGGVWTAGQVHEELDRRGWVSPEAQHPMRATEAAINRLWRKNGEVERVGRGQYRYVVNGQPALADEAGGESNP